MTSLCDLRPNLFIPGFLIQDLQYTCPHMTSTLPLLSRLTFADSPDFCIVCSMNSSTDPAILQNVIWSTISWLSTITSCSPSCLPAYSTNNAPCVCVSCKHSIHIIIAFLNKMGQYNWSIWQTFISRWSGRANPCKELTPQIGTRVKTVKNKQCATFSVPRRHNSKWHKWLIDCKTYCTLQTTLEPAKSKTSPSWLTSKLS